MVTTLSNDCIHIYCWEISLTENEVKCKQQNFCRHSTHGLLSALTHLVTHCMQLKTRKMHFGKTATINETERNSKSESNSAACPRT